MIRRADEALFPMTIYIRNSSKTDDLFQCATGSVSILPAPTYVLFTALRGVFCTNAASLVDLLTVRSERFSQTSIPRRFAT